MQNIQLVDVYEGNETEGSYFNLTAENLTFYSSIDCSYHFNDSFWRQVLTSD